MKFGKVEVLDLHGYNSHSDANIGQFETDSPWPELFEGIRAGSPDAARKLRQRLLRGLHFLLVRRVDTPLASEIAETLLATATEAIRDGSISDHEELLESLRRSVSGIGPSRELPLTEQPPTGQASVSAPVATLVAKMRRLPEHEREALTGFYVNGRSSIEVCRAAGISETDFARIRADLRAACSATHAAARATS